MPYPAIIELENIWNLFNKKIAIIEGLNRENLSDIKKLMTASSVIDLSL